MPSDANSPPIIAKLSGLKQSDLFENHGEDETFRVRSGKKSAKSKTSSNKRNRHGKDIVKVPSKQLNPIVREIKPNEDSAELLHHGDGILSVVKTPQSKNATMIGMPQS